MGLSFRALPPDFPLAFIPGFLPASIPGFYPPPRQPREIKYESQPADILSHQWLAALRFSEVAWGKVDSRAKAPHLRGDSKAEKDEPSGSQPKALYHWTSQIKSMFTNLSKTPKPQSSRRSDLESPRRNPAPSRQSPATFHSWEPPTLPRPGFARFISIPSSTWRNPARTSRTQSPMSRVDMMMRRGGAWRQIARAEGEG